MVKKREIVVGADYAAKVSGAVVVVRITGESVYGGWHGHNLSTGREVRVKTAGRLRYCVRAAVVVLLLATTADGQMNRVGRPMNGQRGVAMGPGLTVPPGSYILVNPRLEVRQRPRRATRTRARVVRPPRYRAPNVDVSAKWGGGPLTVLNPYLPPEPAPVVKPVPAPVRGIFGNVWQP